MRRVAALLLSVVVVLAFAASSAQTLRADDSDKDKDKPTCVVSWPESRYVVGYDHIVHMANSCDHDATCTVATDVNPTPQSVTVPKKSQVEVVTFRGSPVAKFIPRVACVMSSS